MQLALTFPQTSLSVNNRAMSSDDADKQDAAKKLRNKALRLLTTREHSREELLRKLAQAKVRTAQDLVLQEDTPMRCARLMHTHVQKLWIGQWRGVRTPGCPRKPRKFKHWELAGSGWPHLGCFADVKQPHSPGTHKSQCQ